VSRNISEVELSLVSLPSIFRYLQFNGWNQIAHPNQRIALFEQSDAGGKTRVLLPISAELADSKERIADALLKLSEFYRSPLDVLIQQITRTASDFLKARLFVSDETRNETVSLEAASEIVWHLRNLVGYTACVQKDPRPFFAKASGLAKDFAEHCRFGHTFRGSFGFSVECPISLPDQPNLFGTAETIPFERQVIERIAFGILDTNKAVIDDDTTPLVNNYKRGFNANVCEVLTKTYEAADGLSLDIEVAWSPELKPSVEIARPRLILDGRSYTFLKTAAKELQKVDEPLPTVITGKIVALRRDEPDEDQTQFERFVTMDWEIEKGTTIKIRVPLGPVEYRTACDAHKEGVRIRVSGTPRKEGKFWVLTAAEQLIVLPK
jgi:hypothetical protein